MKKIRQLLEEHKKSLAILYGRMNPPTAGHEENVNGLKDLAAKHNADHKIIASRSHDAAKNPLASDIKEKHLKRAFPGSKIEVASKEHPTLLHHAAKAHKEGYKNLIVAGGGDRADEYHKLLHKYNGVEGKHGYYKFDHISVHSTGERKKGVSGTDMRNHAKSGNYDEFKKNLPSHIRDNEGHSKELYNDVRKGMGIHENATFGIFKAIFVSGGPGSGKDLVIRNLKEQQNATEVELNYIQNLLNDKHKLVEEPTDQRHIALKERSLLIINSPSDRYDDILAIKEELEELSYKTMMVFVETTDAISRERNKRLTRPLSEGVRFDKWQKSQDNRMSYYIKFEDFCLFKNNESDEELIENSLTDVHEHTLDFISFDLTDDVHTKWINEHFVIEKGPTLITKPAPKIPAFDKDKESQKIKKSGSMVLPKVVKTPGIGPTYDNRSAQGNIYPVNGLGNVLTQEDHKYNVSTEEKSKVSFSNLRHQMVEGIDDPKFVDGSEMGVGGTLGGSTNKEPLVTPKDQLANLGQGSQQNKKKKSLGAFRK